MMNKLLTILGPTACGKTSFATRLALELDGEIISADSRQVFRGMDIGTGKDIEDYHIGGVDIPYHLIDIADAGERYSVYAYQRDFHQAYKSIIERGKTPILCGGTGLYIESVLKGYEFDGRVMPEINSLIIGLDINRELRRERITQRLKKRLDEGMVDEIRTLLAKGVPSERLIRYGLEYKFITLYVLGELKYEEMVELLEIAIHQFAKRQMTWFRGMEQRRGFKISWLDVESSVEERVDCVKRLWTDFLNE